MFTTDVSAAEVKTHRYGDYDLRVCIADPNGREWYDVDWPTPPEIPELQKSRLKEGAVVFDLGAHQGIVAMLLAKAVGPTGKVIAVDAHPHNVQVAQRNFELNGLRQATIHNGAINDRVQKLGFLSDLNGQLGIGETWESKKDGWIVVDGITINSMIEKHGHPDVIFVDVEGAEGYALAGASRAFEKPTDFFVEIHSGTGLEAINGSVKEVLSYFSGGRHDLTVRLNGETTFRPIRPGEDLLTAGHFWLVAKAK